MSIRTRIWWLDLETHMSLSRIAGRMGRRDLRRLTGLLLQPLALDPFGGCEKPVWHCSIRAAPGDRTLSDEEWGQVAAAVMDRTGFARHDDESGVRWVAVRHAPDHIHLVATLARQDGRRARTWNDFFRVREACRDAEQQLGLRATAPADHTAAKQPSRAEREQALRRGWDETPRVSLRREVCAAAAGAGSEREFFTRLERAGVLVRKRHSTINPDEVTGYAVGLTDHTTKDGGVVWYGGGKLAPDLTLPKLRARWTGPVGEGPGQPVHGVMARAVLRGRVTAAAERARDETDFFAQLRENGVLVRLRYSEINPAEVTGYAVAHLGYTERDGSPRWYGGGRVAAGLTLPRLRRLWGQEHTGAGSFRLTGPERDAFYRHAAQQAAAAAEQIRRSAGNDPRTAADTAWAAAAAFHATARAIGNPALRDVADAFDRAARMAYGKIPPRTAEGDRLRVAARLLAMAGGRGDGSTQGAVQLTVGLVRLATAVGELRQAEQHAAQAAAARQAAERLHASLNQARGRCSSTRRATAATAVPHCAEATRHRQPGLPDSAATRPAPTGGRQQHRQVAGTVDPGTRAQAAQPGRTGPLTARQLQVSAARNPGRSVPPWFNTCRLTVARPVDKSLTNDQESRSPSPEPASELHKLVGDTGIEPVTSSVSSNASATATSAPPRSTSTPPRRRRNRPRSPLQDAQPSIWCVIYGVDALRRRDGDDSMEGVDDQRP